MSCAGIFIVLLFLVDMSGGEKPRKICRGMSHDLSYGGSIKEKARLYRQLYENCTIVNGNLEVGFMTSSKYDVDLSFLRDIEEVTGYVRIEANTASRLHLNNLRIIRGATLCSCQGDLCSLYITINHHPDEPEMGLKQLELVSLQDILAGNVKIYMNKYLCYANNINWKDIFTSPTSTFSVNGSDFCTKECHESCMFQGKKYCWGEGPQMCQRMTKVICSPQCNNKCRGTTPDHCCHNECAVGCTGPSNTECLACKNFNNDGTCLEHCPPVTIYNPITLMHEENPNARYAYGSVCLKKCPAHLSTDNGACVTQCASAVKHIVNGSCVDCSGSCPKVCPGTSDMGLDSNVIQEYRGCKVIHGNLLILAHSMKDDPNSNTSALTLKQLEWLESIEEITGSLQIQISHPDIHNLWFLKNLKIIRGINLLSDLSSLSISATSLSHLRLHSLAEISYGNVDIVSNRQLCFVETMDWGHLLMDPENQKVIIDENNPSCESHGLICSPQCTHQGCWGPDNFQCLSCRNFRFGRQCVESCLLVPPAYMKDNETCERCHSECADSCTGENSTECISCLHVRDGSECVASCPNTKYTNSNNTCEPCHDNCGNHGCTGPASTVGPTGCKSCALVLFGNPQDAQEVTECLHPKTAQCANGYFKIPLNDYPENHSLYMKLGCKQCHPECIVCDASTEYCKQCRNYRLENKCVEKCSDGFYPESPQHPRESSPSTPYPFPTKNELSCFPCDPTCLSCFGPKSSDCYSCKSYLIYFDYSDPSKGFNCSTTCPVEVPFKVTKEVDGMKLTVCDPDDDVHRKFMTRMIVISVVVTVGLVSIIIFFIVFVKFKKARDRSRVMLAAANLLEGKTEPITSSGIVGDNSTVGTISEKDLRLGEKIGSGAFGSVYKGIWSPPGANCRIYVAIKIAHNCFGSQTDEVLGEVQVMSTLVNDHCIRILGICLVSRIMIITQLMPYGCMLEFIQKNKDNIGSKVLLNWAMQIAKGMAYLESKGIIHRDLAARNVLVQNDNHVRITDFGLSKIIFGRNSYKSAGDKLPIKWLALESLKNKCFTHKSDVWSYGVTLWEMLTFGKKPYEHVEPTNIVDFLEKGDRLAQPSICTIDVYMWMIRCWVPNADDRPSFQNLVETFTVMARDPARFLVISNDENKELKSTEPMMMLRQLSTIDDEKPVIGAEEYFERAADRKERRKASSSSSLDDEQQHETIQIGWSQKKNNPFFGGKTSNGRAHWSKGKPRASVENKSRYISDPCDELRADSRPASPPCSPSLPLNGGLISGRDEGDYLEPQKTSNGDIFKPQTAFSNPHYFQFPLQNSNPGTSSTSVPFKSNKFDGRLLSQRESTNDVFEETAGPSSSLLLSSKNKNNNEYYNDFLKSTRSSSHQQPSLLGV